MWCQPRHRAEMEGGKTMSQKGYDEAFNYLWTHDAVSLLLEDGSIVTGDFSTKFFQRRRRHHTGY